MAPQSNSGKVATNALAVRVLVQPEMERRRSPSQSEPAKVGRHCADPLLGVTQDRPAVQERDIGSDGGSFCQHEVCLLILVLVRVCRKKRRGDPVQGRGRSGSVRPGPCPCAPVSHESGAGRVVCTLNRTASLIRNPVSSSTHCAPPAPVPAHSTQVLFGVSNSSQAASRESLLPAHKVESAPLRCSTAGLAWPL